MAETKKIRQANFELLRCVSMFLIVVGHYFGNVASNADFQPVTFSWAMYYFINSIEGIGVDLFIILSCWFLLTSKFSINKILMMWFQLFIYSVAFYLIVNILHGNFSLPELLKSCVPIYSRKYWFITEYIRLYLIFPLLNIAVYHMNKKQHCYAAILLFLMNCIFPTFMSMDYRLRYIGNWSLWFITLYFVVTYIRKYSPVISKKILWIVYLASTICMFLSKCAIDMVSTKLTGSTTGVDLLSHNNSIFMFAAALSFFLLFRSVTINNKKMANFILHISPGMMGVYLFHENPTLKPYLYQFIHNCFTHFGIDNFGGGGLLWLLVGILACILIFVTGWLIDFVYRIASKKVLFAVCRSRPVSKIQCNINNYVYGGENP